MDILDVVYGVLEEDEEIQSNIKFFEYPEVKEIDSLKIVIDPLDSPDPADFADNKWLTLDFQIQIDVFSDDRHQTNNVADKIRDLMWDSIGFKQKNGPRSYEHGVFRDVRRYRGKLYREDFDSL